MQGVKKTMLIQSGMSHQLVCSRANALAFAEERCDEVFHRDSDSFDGTKIVGTGSKQSNEVLLLWFLAWG